MSIQTTDINTDPQLQQDHGSRHGLWLVGITTVLGSSKTTAIHMAFGGNTDHSHQNIPSYERWRKHWKGERLQSSQLQHYSGSLGKARIIDLGNECVFKRYILSGLHRFYSLIICGGKS